MSDTLFCQLIERPVKLDRIGCGQGPIAFARRRNHADRADACRAISKRAPYLPGECRNGCFPAGTRDGGDRCRLVRKDFRRGKRKCATRIGNANKRDRIRKRIRVLLGGDGNGTGARGLFCEMRAIGFGACDCDEQETWFDFAAVGRNAGGFDCTQPRIGRRLRQKIAQLHRVSFALTSSI